MPYTSLENAVLSEKIDWLAYSQANSLEWSFLDCIDGHWKRINPIRNYTNGEENKQGVKRYWNNINNQQGKYVVMSGAAWDTLRENQLDVLHMVNTTDRKATRIDFALDILHSKFHPSMVRRHLRRGEAVTHAQSILTMFDEKKGGYTQYVGTKSSETYTRVYDKAFEQKVDFAWVRLETVYQGERARPALSSFCEHQSTRELIKSHVDFPAWNDWQKLMSNSVVKLAIPSRKAGTRAWLLSQVAKSIAREIAMDEDHKFWFELGEEVKKQLAIFEKKEENIEW